ncbi:unnamed protein product [marine sediment metagenome]|uniref:Uncharacterized protein n=1 Tax=marine sediment metagenome TaxID=412755 RepID=X1T8Y1_9ZZZZ
MAVSIGNKTQVNQTPASNFYQFTHNQNTGNDGLLVVSVVMTNTVSFTNATYGGVAMSQVFVRNFGGLSQTTKLFVLENPNTGNNTFRINFTGNQFNPISVFVLSCTGAKAGGNIINLAGTSSPKNSNITVLDGSYIYSYCVSTSAILGIEIPNGNNRPAEYTHNTNRQVRGGLSASSFTAGTYNITHITSFTSVTMQTYEIQEKSVTPPVSGNDGDFFLMM